MTMDAAVNTDQQELVFGPSDTLRALAALAGEGQSPDPLPNRLPITAIEQRPDLFQPRGMDERHLNELQRAIRTHGHLDPLLVIQVGRTPVLLDGHHRVEAYRIAGVTDGVPVAYFTGSLEQAVLEAGRANSKAKLPMTSNERTDYGWRLVLLGQYTKKQIREAAGISDGTVATMRRVKAALGDEAYDWERWFQALSVYQGKQQNILTDDEMKDKLQAQANDYADRLTNEFGTKLSNNVTLAAMALEIHFGRRMPELALELRHHLPDFDDEDLDY
ncbi:ParB/RepB/Spo0J family partition protein [Hwanghaeella sp.]|uniref:ParB/RepB/Spo0J family partition protein n=1 Tax=Hwanghaeella sp. TaxID=2605943 RepID=UPI003CCBF5BE